MRPDIVYIYNEKLSRWRGQELKLSLRSLEKHGQNYNNVYLIGDKPPYLNDKIIHIPMEDDQKNSREKRICEKILTACRAKEISDPFVIFNDDYFLVNEIDFSELHYHYFNDLGTKAKNRGKNDMYKQALQNTLIALLSKGLPTKHFDIHYPMYYHKENFIKVMEQYDWTVKGGYVIKSLYANTLEIEGLPRKDHKIYLNHNKREITEAIANIDLFSTEHISRAMAEILHKLYPERSSYELN